MKRYSKYLVFIVSVLFLCGCTGPVPPEVNIPTEGTWYCEELQAQLIFDPPYGVYSSVTIDGEELTCHVGNHRGSLDLLVYYQGELHAEYDLGETLYWFVFVDRDEEKMAVKDHDTDEMYTFERVN